jgi:hypothetical protein
MDPKSLPGLDQGGNRLPAFAKPASARRKVEKIMIEQNGKDL